MFLKHFQESYQLKMMSIYSVLEYKLKVLLLQVKANQRIQIFFLSYFDCY